MKKIKSFLFASLISLAIFPLVNAADVSKTIEIGSPFTIKLTSIDGTSPFTFQWLKNGTTIPGATNSSYIVPISSQNSAGVYTLKVTNSKGEAVSNKANLSITITIAPSNPVIEFE